MGIGLSCLCLFCWQLVFEERRNPIFVELSVFDPRAETEDSLGARLDDVLVPDQLSIERGQTLVGVFESIGFDRSLANRATYAMQQHMDPTKLRAGSEFAVYRGQDASVRRVVIPVDRKGEVSLIPNGAEIDARWREYRVEERTHVVEGTLDRDLSSAMADAGAPFSLAFALADVLQWDLDFNRDLRTGDEFRVAYRARWVEGRLEEIAAIDAAVYINRGRGYEAYRFESAEADGYEGYYDEDGRPLRKQFLRSPLPFTRVTSRFSHSRLHPILKVRRPHYGVDYGAPRGTPVRATAAGSVTFRGRSGGAGNMVRLRHPNGFETSYLHLSRFHANACRGCRVRQGEVIGFVGSTGLSTAPHLDYRVKRNGRYIDPLKLESRPAPPLTGRLLDEFSVRLEALRTQLAWAPRSLLADGQPVFDQAAP